MTDATRLRGDGTKITLLEGEVVELVFDFDALCEAEEMFGSLDEFTQRLNSGSTTKIMQAVVGGVAAALRHLGTAPTPEVVRKMLDPRRTAEYIDALGVAFDLAMPDPDPADDGGKDVGETAGSPGTGGTTSPPSDTTEATPPSGA